MADPKGAQASHAADPKHPVRDSQGTDDSLDEVIEDESSVSELVGEEMVEEFEHEFGEPISVGHGGMPMFLIVCLVLVFVWAMVAWKPWTGY